MRSWLLWLVRLARRLLDHRTSDTNGEGGDGMKTVERERGETIDDLVRRYYTVRWVEGVEDEERVELATQAVLEANSGLGDEQREVRLPEVEGIPYLRKLLDDTRLLHPTVHEALDSIENSERLMLLSFIDPIRLGCEELGIAVTQEVAADVRQRLEGVLSFDQERYVEVRDGEGGLHGIESIRWVARR